MMEMLVIEFFIFSVIGWIWETTVKNLSPTGSHVKNPFFYGPYKVIYGFGGVLLVELCRPIADQPLLILLAAFVIGTIVELITSVFLLKVFHERVWDYRKSNIINVSKYTLDGHISLVVSCVWAMFATFIFYVFVPYVDMIGNFLITNFGSWPAIIIGGILIVDGTFSTIHRFRRIKKEKSARKHKKPRGK